MKRWRPRPIPAPHQPPPSPELVQQHIDSHGPIPTPDLAELGIEPPPDLYTTHPHLDYYRVWTADKPLVSKWDKALLNRWIRMNRIVRYVNFNDPRIDNLLFGEGKNLFESVHTYNKIHFNLS